VIADAVPNFPPIVTLIPQSGLQFLDFGMTLDGSVRLNRAFLEEDVPGEGHVLQALVNQNGEQLHPVTGAVVESASYSVNPQRALDPFLNAWVPIPFMRVLGRDAEGRDVYDQGPSNWARLYVAPDGTAEADGQTSYRLVLAFDTEIDGRERNEDEAYLMPTITDARSADSFGFSSNGDDVAWFVGETWVDTWIKELFQEFQRRRDGHRRARPDAPSHMFEHTARFLTFLNLIELACPFPTVRLIDNVSAEKAYVPIKVDLVIDVGNSRTCGILIESDPDSSDRLDLARSFVLALRDLSRPTDVHRLPFESRVEFARASFGKDGISRLSGRPSAFFWPSFVRIGPEAVRLSVGASGTEGATGMSSPKRYLWDERPLNQVWRFRLGEDRGAPEPQVSGPLLAFVTESGDVLRQLKPNAIAAIRPKFSRSSLFTFLMTEVVLQAVTAINSVESRGRQRNRDIPRELRQIVMTVPPATPLAELRIMKQRVEGAVKLAWQALGWTDGRKTTPPPEPQVHIAFDEATCTQIVYLYAETTQKLRSPAADLFKILGKVRPSASREPSLRVASIDIGGGTTDLMVINYKCESHSAIVPVQLFREGFKIAGDDILEAVVGRHVLPAIEAHLAASGLTEARAFLRGIVGADRGGQPEQERQFRRRLVTQLCVPAALNLLHSYEATKPFSEEPAQVMRLGAMLGADILALVVEDFEQQVQALTQRPFALLDAPVTFKAEDVAATIQSVMSVVLSDLSELVHAYDCDVVLLSGRPSRFPIVLDLLQSRLPTRPDRIIPMHQYRVGNWYPFRDRADRIDDPKTTVAVGALLCSLAETQLDGFVIAKRNFQMKSTARCIGVMDLSNKIRKSQLLFSNVDLDGKKRADESACRLTQFLPATLGFRQLPLERWPASPLYALEYANAANAARLKLPLTMTIERRDPDGEDETKREDFHITEVQDADGTSMKRSDVVMRLQTLKSSSGYWLDTGIVESYR
jgi:hypothetical protein